MYLGDTDHRDSAAPTWARFKVHVTPKHSSWLNAAEMEASLDGRECLGKRRIPNRATARRSTLARRRDASRNADSLEFRVKDACRVFGYDKLRSTRSQH